MKKIIVFTLLTFIIFLSFLFFWQNKEKNKVVNKTIKDLSKSKKVKFNIDTILFSTNKNVENHFTSLKNILFYNKNIIVTSGGIIKNDFVNRFFNSTEFNEITFQEKGVIIAYRDGFLLLKDNYINHFVFNEVIKKCLAYKDDFFCIKNKTIIKEGDFNPQIKQNDFIEYYKSNNKINDILIDNHRLFILTDKNLIVKDKNNENKISILNANKLVKIDNRIFIISDREVFKFENNSIFSFKKVSSISNLVFKNNKIYFISINGVIYNKELKKEYSINSLVNNITYENDNVYIVTQDGVYLWDDKINKLNLEVLNGVIAENYITRITNYKDENILISYFNSGIDIFNERTGEIKAYIKNLNGVNDILVKDNNLYIATTDGLYFYDDKLKYYGKKDGIIGTSVSKIEWYKNSIFIGSEGGVSQKVGDLFTSIFGMHGLINNRVNSMKIVNNYLYIGTLGGISVLNGLKVIKNFTNKNFRSPWITAIEAVNDIVYIASYGGGVYKMESNDILNAKINIKKITSSKKRLFFNLNTLVNYKNKYLLAGTLKNGIWVYNIEKNRDFFIKDLPSLNITAIKIIGDKLFIGSDFGFWHISVENILR